MAPGRIRLPGPLRDPICLDLPRRLFVTLLELAHLLLGGAEAAATREVRSAHGTDGSARSRSRRSGEVESEEDLVVEDHVARPNEAVSLVEVDRAPVALAGGCPHLCVPSLPEVGRDQVERRGPVALPLAVPI